MILGGWMTVVQDPVGWLALFLSVLILNVG
jgi:hypothetical protein